MFFTASGEIGPGSRSFTALLLVSTTVIGHLPIQVLGSLGIFEGGTARVTGICDWNHIAPHFRTMSSGNRVAGRSTARPYVRADTFVRPANRSEVIFAHKFCR